MIRAEFLQHYTFAVQCVIAQAIPQAASLVTGQAQQESDLAGKSSVRRRVEVSTYRRIPSSVAAWPQGI